MNCLSPLMLSSATRSARDANVLLRSRVSSLVLSCFLFSLIFGLSATVVASSLSAGNPLLSNARLIYQEQPKLQNYVLILSEIKKVDGTWRAEKEQRKEALVSRKTYELNNSFRIRDAMALLRKHTEYSGRLVNVFKCQGLDCGSSNAWANTFFNIKQLYGLDASQYYSVWEGVTAQGQAYILVYYLVERGNGSLMLQEDYLLLSTGVSNAVSPADDVLMAQLIKEKRVVIPGLTSTATGFEWDKSALIVVLDVLVNHPDLKVRLVGHDAYPGSLAQQMDRGKRMADFVLKKLLEFGVDRSRLSTYTVGSLSPDVSERLSRVEMVLIPDS